MLGKGHAGTITGAERQQEEDRLMQLFSSSPDKTQVRWGHNETRTDQKYGEIYKIGQRINKEW